MDPLLSGLHIQQQSHPSGSLAPPHHPMQPVPVNRQINPASFPQLQQQQQIGLLSQSRALLSPQQQQQQQQMTLGPGMPAKPLQHFSSPGALGPTLILTGKEQSIVETALPSEASEGSSTHQGGPLPMGTVPESVAPEPGEVKPSLSGDSQLLLVQPQAQPWRTPFPPLLLGSLHLWVVGRGAHFRH